MSLFVIVLVPRQGTRGAQGPADTVTGVLSSGQARVCEGCCSQQGALLPHWRIGSFGPRLLAAAPGRQWGQEGCPSGVCAPTPTCSNVGDVLEAHVSTSEDRTICRPRVT